MVIAQALVSGVVGFCLGIGASATLGLLVKNPAMPYQLSWGTLVFTGVTVLAVTVFSATLSAMKVIKLEPARVFAM
jgi:putative ABC transport system permease protein